MRNSDSAYSIWFSQVLLKLFTHKHKSSFNNKDRPLRWLGLRGLRTLRVRLRRPSGVLPALYNLLAFNNFHFNVYGAIDNKNVRRNRIGQNLGQDNVSMQN